MILFELNVKWNRVNFYEGVVAKRAQSSYPVQLRDPEAPFPGWMKHRWAY